MHSVFNMPVDCAKWVEIYLSSQSDIVVEETLQIVLNNYHKGAYNG